MLTMITTVDDLNYPEKTETYYIVNAPYVFSACWKVVKPLLQERTKKKIQVLYGSGRDELLKVKILNMSLKFGSDISFSVMKVSILISSLCSFV
jgi:hypothetical protein